MVRHSGVRGFVPLFFLAVIVLIVIAGLPAIMGSLDDEATVTVNATDTGNYSAEYAGVASITVNIADYSTLLLIFIGIVAVIAAVWGVIKFC